MRIPLLTLLLPALMLTGCASASLVKTVYQPMRGGVAKYRNSLLSGGRSEEKAKSLIADFCMPLPYSIVSQEAASETAGYRISRDRVTADSISYTYIQFQCDVGASSVSQGQ